MAAITGFVTPAPYPYNSMRGRWFLRDERHLVLLDVVVLFGVAETLEFKFDDVE